MKVRKNIVISSELVHSLTSCSPWDLVLKTAVFVSTENADLAHRKSKGYPEGTGARQSVSRAHVSRLSVFGNVCCAIGESHIDQSIAFSSPEHQNQVYIPKCFTQVSTSLSSRYFKSYLIQTKVGVPGSPKDTPWLCFRRWHHHALAHSSGGLSLAQRRL